VVVTDKESLEDTGGLWGHPRGLTTLFFTEMWERFSFYGIRGILTLYMVAAPAQGGLGFNVPYAATVYGIFQMMSFLLSFVGGLIADRYIGGKLAVLIGGIIIAMGNFTLVFPGQPAFFAGLVLVVTGTMFLKPNIGTMLGSLYGKNDNRRDGGFSIFYMGINTGAALAPLVVGFLAQSTIFKGWLQSAGISPESCWHWGFGIAGVGMLCGLTQYLANRDRLKSVGNPPPRKAGVAATCEPVLTEKATNAESSETAETPKTSDKTATGAAGSTEKFILFLTREEWRRIGALGVLVIFGILFWSIYEQAGTSLTLFADRLTRHDVFGMEFPSSWFLSLNPIFVMIMAPIYSMMWIKMGDRAPSSPGKFACGLLILSIGIGIMVPAAMLTAGGRISPLWLVAVYFVECLSELCVSPVGLSTVTKLAPQRLVGFFMGLWLCATALGGLGAGLLARLFTTDPERMVYLFGGMSIAAMVASGILACLTPSVRKLMTGIR
jgi:proton-dependent oligopeptide transporter, POT family